MVFFISVVLFLDMAGYIAQADLEFTVEFWLASNWVLLPQPPKSWGYTHKTTMLHLHFPNAGYVFSSSEAAEEKHHGGEAKERAFLLKVFKLFAHFRLLFA